MNRFFSCLMIRPWSDYKTPEGKTQVTSRGTKTLTRWWAHQRAGGCDPPPTAESHDSSTSTSGSIDSISWRMRLVKTFSQPRRRSSSVCVPPDFTSTLHRFPVPPPPRHATYPSDALFILMFAGFLTPCAWSIKHPCVLAPSPLHPPVLFLKPNWEPELIW